MTGSERITRFLTKKLPTFSGSTIFCRFSSIISQLTYRQLYFLPISWYSSAALSYLSFCCGMRIQAISYRPCRMAYSIVLSPILSMWLGSAPLLSNNLTTPTLFFLMAEIRGVSPRGEAKLTSALYLSISRVHISRLLVVAAWFKAVTFETAVRGSLISCGLF